MSERLVLYIGEKNISSWSMRAFVCMKLKGLEFEERTISLPGDKDRRKRLEISPTGKVPVLHHGRRVIPDSLAILEYLEEVFPAPAYPALWPADRDERAHARWLAATMHSSFPSLRESMSFNLCFLPERPPASAAALEDAAQMLGLFESVLGGKPGGGPFLFGPLGGVDAMFAPAVVRLTAFNVPTTSTPRAGRYLASVLEHPAVRSWMEPARALPPRADD
jgi:glutathione S-transferase